MILFNLWFAKFERNDKWSAEATINRLEPKEKRNIGNYNEILKQRNELLSRMAPPKKRQNKEFFIVLSILCVLLVVVEFLFAFLQINLNNDTFSSIVSGVPNIAAMFVARQSFKSLENERSIYYYFMKYGVDPEKIIDNIEDKYIVTENND